MAIHLSGLPGERPFSETGRAARLPRLALLRVGFTEPAGSPPSLVRSYRTLSPLPVRTRRPAIGGFLSVALSCGSPRLAVSQHPALRSPDLPRHDPACGPCRGHPADSPSPPVCHRPAQPHHTFRRGPEASHRRFPFRGTFLRVTPTSREPAPCSAESRPSSTRSRCSARPHLPRTHGQVSRGAVHSASRNRSGHGTPIAAWIRTLA